MRKTFFLFTLAVASLLFGQTASVSGYVLEGQKWPNGFVTMNLQLESESLPEAGLSDGSGSWNDVAQAALEEWNQYLNKVQFDSNTTTLTPKSGDGINTVFFSSSAFGQSFGSEAIAITVRWYTLSTETTTEADVVVNTAYQWDSYRGDLHENYEGTAYIFDLRRVLDHEFGHVLGLNHPDLANPPQNVVAIMNSVIGNLDHIEMDDIDGAMDLYGTKTFLEQISVSSSPTGGGYVTGGGNFQVGSTQQVTAVPAPGYTLAQWEDGSTNPTRSIVVPVGGATYTATFRLSLATWQDRYSFDYLNGLLYANNQFYAFGSAQAGTNTTLTSPDGVTWTPHAAVTLPSISSGTVAYGNGKFVYVDGTTIYTSTDAITWTQSATPLSSSGGLITFGNGIFVLAGGANASSMLYSTDGINWTMISLTQLPSFTTDALTYGNGHFVAVGQESGTTNASLVSSDGINWTSAIISQDMGHTGFNSVTGANGIYIATGLFSDVILHSTDGLNWVASTFPGEATYEGEVECTASGDGIFLAITEYEVLTSTDGATWTLQPGNGFYGNSVVFGDNTFVAAASSELVQSGQLVSSSTLTQQTIIFPAIATQTYGVAPITLGATATSSLPVTFSIVSGPATISGHTLTVTGAGTVVVAADQLGNGTTYAAAPEVTMSFAVNPATLTITAKSQSKAPGKTYDFIGTEFTASGLQNGDTVGLVQLTSTGATASATIAGSPFPILAGNAGGGTFDPSNYTINYVSGTLSITGPKETAKVTLGNLAATYDGTAKQVTVTTTPTGLDVTVTYNGSDTTPTAAGSYPVVATVNDPDYTGSAKGTLIIGKAAATITLSNLAATYDGTPKSVTGTTSPAGLAFTITYAAKATVPINAGSYAVAATIADPNYTGSAKATLVIGKAIAIVNLNQPSLAATYTGKAHPAVAITTPTGLPVTFSYNGKATVPVNTGTYTVAATVNTSNAAGSAGGELVISPEAATIAFGNLAFTYTGKAHPATATTLPAKLPVTFTYNGSATAPSAVGSYPVVATVSNPNYSASANSTLTIGPELPVITTGVAAGISATGATLSSTAVPETSDTMVSFEYGTTTSYGSATTAQDAGNGAAKVTISTVLGVPAQTTAVTYHYRAAAVNAAGTVYGVDKTFIAPAIPGIVTSPEAALSASGAEVNLTVNPAGLAMTVYVQYGTTTDYGSITATQSLGSGKLPVNFFALFTGLDYSTPYHYRVVMTNAQGTIYGPDETFTTLGFQTNLVVEKGYDAAGTPTTFASLGNPAVNADDTVALTGTLTLASGVTTTNEAGIWTIDQTGTQHWIAQTGTGAPGTGGNFLTLNDPVYNDSGTVAFRGTLKPLAGQVTAANAAGIWLGGPGTVQLLARQGSPAPDSTGTGTFATFTSLGLTDSAGAVFAGTLNAGSGITAASNTGIWEGSSAGALTLLLQSGQTVDGETISKLNFLPADTYVGGQTRSFASNGDIACGAIFTNKTTGLVEVINGTPSVYLQSQSPATDISGATFATFGPPIINDTDHTAFAATLTVNVGGVTTVNNSGLWADDSTSTRQLIARTGIGLAPGTTATFASFSDPVYNNSEAIAFRATLKVAAGQSTATTATGIWATDGSPNSLALVAQEGKGQATGCPAGATFATFTELALPDQGGANNTGGVIFLATLNANAAAGVTASNNTGIWAVDSAGALQLIVRTGDVLNGKTVTALSFLPTLSIVNGQSRSFAQANGDLVYLATFSDKSSAVLSVIFP